MLRRSVFSVLLVGFAAGTAHGQTPGMTSFQALVKDAAGDPVTGALNLEFRIFDAATLGNLVDMNGDGFADDVPGLDVKQVFGVEATAGIMSTKFGPIAPSAFDGSARWLEVSVNGLPLSRIEMAAPSAVSSQVNRFGTGVSVMSVDASTGNLELSPDGGGEVGVNAARLTVRTQTVSDADGSAAQAAFATIDVDPATGTIRSSGDLQLATVAGGSVTANAMKITTAALSESGASGLERVLRVKPEGIVSDNDDIEITPGPFRRLKILTSTVADGNASAAGPFPSIDFDPATGTISSSGDLQLAPALGSFVTATAMKILPSGFGAGGASAVTPTIVFKDGGIGVDKGDIDISPGPFGKMKLLASTVAGGDGSAAGPFPSIDFDPVTGTISSSVDLTLTATSGSVIVPGAGGIQSARIRITAAAADGAGSGAGLGGAEFVLSGGDLALQVDGQIVDRWTGPGGAVTGFGPSPNRISGSAANVVAVGKSGAVIGGGGSLGTVNIVNDNFGTIGGGANNQASSNFTTIAGGVGNRASGVATTIAGGQGNNTTSSGWSTIGGGFQNMASGERSFVGGGGSNTASGVGSTVGGGRSNTASNSSLGGSTIAGGHNNTASNDYCTVGGGHANNASGIRATIPGGDFNVASGAYSFAAGRSCVAGGTSSFAMGDNANATGAGMFVWADDNAGGLPFPAPTETTFFPTSRQFLARAKGGVVFVTAIDGSGNSTAGVQVAGGGGSWSSLSDRNAKENLVPVDGRDALEKVAAMPISTWNYKSQDPSIRHIGPMAQDLHAAFGVGEKETLITAIDGDGIALAAIQGLHQISAEKDARIASLEARVQALEDAIQKMSPSTRANMLGLATPALAVAGLFGLIVLGRGRKGVA